MNLWLREAREALAFDPPTRVDEGPYDVVIVGGGLTGAWAAHHLLNAEPALRVAIVERDRCASGASGRNGGTIMSWRIKATQMRSVVGDDETRELFARSDRAFAKVMKIAAGFPHAIPIRSKWGWFACNDAQHGAWAPTVRALEELGVEGWTVIGAEEARDRSNCLRYTGGVVEDDVAYVQPAAFTLSVLRTVMDRGVKVFERSPMRRLERQHGGWRVHTPSGALQAGKVVLALNAWAHCIQQWRRTLLPVASDLILTKPVSPNQQPTDFCGITHARMRNSYFALDPKGRRFQSLGARRTARFGNVDALHGTPSPIAGQIEQELGEFYPQLADAGVADSWTGAIARSVEALPAFGEMDGHPGVYYGHGYAGIGMLQTYLGGEILSELALGAAGGWRDCGLVRRPPSFLPREPVRSFTAEVGAAAIRAADQAEKKGRKPGRLTVAATRLVPKGMFPLGKVAAR